MSKILILGASGYIGGTFLNNLLKSYQPKNITVFIRDEKQASLFQNLSVNIEKGFLEDLDHIQHLASQYDVIVNFAVAFGGDEKSISALVQGQEKRAEDGKANFKPVYIHTGGTGTFMYGKDGEKGTDTWTDEQYDRINKLPEGSYFFGGYKVVAQAALKGIISAYTIVSPTVYGPGTGRGNKLSLQVPAYVKYAEQNEQAAYIGEGENVWGNVHIQDLTELYQIIIDYALKNPEKTKASQESYGFETLIYSGVRQHAWKPLIEHLATLLYARGEVKEPTAVPIAEGQGLPYMFGGNSFMTNSEKAKRLGFQPRQHDITSALDLALSK